VKATAADQRQNVTPLNDGRSRGELQLRPKAGPSVNGYTQAPEAVIGAGFVVGGFVAAAASLVQLIIDRGGYLPEVVFRGLHVLGPLALIVPAAGGFMMARSRLARRLSVLTVGFLAIWAGWDRFDLPALDWTVPRFLLGALWIVRGVLLLRKKGSQSDAALDD
jgi:hypothetical protein